MTVARRSFHTLRTPKVHKKSPTAQNAKVFVMQDIPFSSSQDRKEVLSQPIQSLRTPGRFPLNSDLPRICLFLSVALVFGSPFNIEDLVFPWVLQPVFFLVGNMEAVPN